MNENWIWDTLFKRHGRDPGETDFFKLYFLFFFSLFKYDFLFKGNAPKKLKINNKYTYNDKSSNHVFNSSPNYSDLKSFFLIYFFSAYVNSYRSLKKY